MALEKEVNNGTTSARRSPRRKTEKKPASVTSSDSSPSLWTVQVNGTTATLTLGKETFPPITVPENANHVFSNNKKTIMFYNHKQYVVVDISEGRPMNIVRRGLRTILVTCAAISDDRNYIMVGTQVGSVIVWDIRPDDPIPALSATFKVGETGVALEGVNFIKKNDLQQIKGKPRGSTEWQKVRATTLESQRATAAGKSGH